MFTVVEGYIEVTGAVAASFVICAAAGEMLIPLAVAHAYHEGEHPRSFLAIIAGGGALMLVSTIALFIAGRGTKRGAALRGSVELKEGTGAGAGGAAAAAAAAGAVATEVAVETRRDASTVVI